jgi:hypothetical protein
MIVSEDYISHMLVRNAHKAVVPAEFPELAMLAWNRNPERPIPGEEALALYERNWRHVDKAHLTPEEAELIHELVEKFGKGYLLAT